MASTSTESLSTPACKTSLLQTIAVILSGNHILSYRHGIRLTGMVFVLLVTSSRHASEWDVSISHDTKQESKVFTYCIGCILLTFNVSRSVAVKSSTIDSGKWLSVPTGSFLFKHTQQSVASQKLPILPSTHRRQTTLAIAECNSCLVVIITNYKYLHLNTI